MNIYIPNTKELVSRSNACLTFAKLYSYYQENNNIDIIIDYFSENDIKKYFGSIDNLINFIINENKEEKDIIKFIEMNDEVVYAN